MNPAIVKKIFPKEAEAVSLGKCPFCNADVNHASFRDELSRREFAISGLCQTCQDDTFTDLED